MRRTPEDSDSTFELTTPIRSDFAEYHSDLRSRAISRTGVRETTRFPPGTRNL
jgi:hypothetical protein